MFMVSRLLAIEPPLREVARLCEPEGDGVKNITPWPPKGGIKAKQPMLH